MPAFTNICIIIADTIKYYKQIISQETDVNKYGQLLQVTSTPEFIFYLNLFDDLWFNDDVSWLDLNSFSCFDSWFDSTFEPRLSCFKAFADPTVRAFRDNLIDPDTGSLP